MPSVTKMYRLFLTDISSSYIYYSYMDQYTGLSIEPIIINAFKFSYVITIKMNIYRTNITNAWRLPPTETNDTIPG